MVPIIMGVTVYTFSEQQIIVSVIDLRSKCLYVDSSKENTSLHSIIHLKSRLFRLIRKSAVRDGKGNIGV